MARTVGDVAAALQAVAGYDDYDPRQHRGIPQSIDVLSGLNGGVKGLRIGILEEGFAEPIEAEGRRRSSWLLISTLENPWRRSH